MPCAFQYAESDDTSDPAVSEAGGYVYQGNNSNEDLPTPSTLSRADLRGVIPPDTIYDLAGEAAGGGGAAVFANASSSAGSRGAFDLLLAALAVAGLYAAYSRNS